jgi:hypothetical protein
LLIISFVAVATRMVTFGNPAINQDDQFYLLVGDAMRHGAWPYIDIWDRKPIGLFLLFAGIAGVAGPSILFMQGVATAFAAATAWLIRAVALRFSDRAGALLAALAYLLMQPLFGGQSGQSPVFYNLLITGAFALVAGAIDCPASEVRRRAFGAKLLCGITLMIKPVSIVECLFIGCAFLWLFARAGLPRGKIIAVAALMVVIALIPSLLALAVYAPRGRAALDAYVYANFVSIFAKHSLGSTARLAGLAYLAIYILPLGLFAAMGVAERRRQRGVLPALIMGWIAAAVVGYLLVPNFFDHYALPLLAPLSVSAASLFARRDGAIFFAALALFCLVHGAIVDRSGNRRAAGEIAAVGRTIERARHGGCLLVADGPAWLYAQVDACRVTPFLFPGHLTLAVEADAIGVDHRAALASALARRPAVIVTLDNERDQHAAGIDRLLHATLDRNYRRIARLTDDSGPLLATLGVWQRSDLPPPQR